MNRKSIEERAKIIQLLVEGNSLRSTSRIADCSINTVTKLLEDVGAVCAEYQSRTLVNLPCKQLIGISKSHTCVLQVQFNFTGILK